MSRAVRSDALPEHATYVDAGCDLAPRCLECPFSKCRYDLPGGIRVLERYERGLRAKALQRQGLSVDAIAATTGMSRRQTFRDLND